MSFNPQTFKTLGDIAYVKATALAAMFFATEDTAAQVQADGYFDEAHRRLKGPTPVMILAQATKPDPQLLIGVLVPGVTKGKAATKKTPAVPGKPYVKLTLMDTPPELELEPIVSRIEALEGGAGDDGDSLAERIKALEDEIKALKSSANSSGKSSDKF